MRSRTQERQAAGYKKGDARGVAFFILMVPDDPKSGGGGVLQLRQRADLDRSQLVARRRPVPIVVARMRARARRLEQLRRPLSHLLGAFATTAMALTIMVTPVLAANPHWINDPTASVVSSTSSNLATFSTRPSN